MKRRIWIGLIVITFMLSLLAKSVVASPLPPSASTFHTSQFPAKSVSKLTPRLNALTQSGTLRTASAETQAVALSLSPQGPGSLIRDTQGRLLVEIRTNGFSETDLANLRNAGAEIADVSERYGIISAYMDAVNLSALGNIASVQSVQEALAPMTTSSFVHSSGTTNTSSAPTGCPQGNAVSEGDTQLRANLARSTYSIDGTGVTVGVLSDSYNTASAPATTAPQDVTSGDLPGTTNPCGHTTPVAVTDYPNSTDEGRGMSQIVHDLAPGATLRFATAWSTDTTFANNIRALRTAGADIIVDDISYFNEPFFQDGIVTVAISDVVGAGALYFTSAANSNIIIGGNNVASNEAPTYRPTTCPTVVTNYGPEESCHNFNATGGNQNYMSVTLVNNGSVKLILQWAQPWYGVTTDLDFVMTNSTDTTIVAASGDPNPGATGTQKPFEFLNYQNTSGSTQTYHVYIARFTGNGFTGTPRTKIIMMAPLGAVTAVAPSTSSGSDIVGPTIFGHSASHYALSVAAAPYNDNNNPETFSSRGPATHYFGPVLNTTPASAITPDPIQQPDFAATDGGCTTFFGGFSGGCYRFYGTSAAAPHAAAVTALLKQKATQMGVPLTRNSALSLLSSTARSMSGGNLNSVGAGLIDALGAVQALASQVTSHSLFLPLILKSGSTPLPGVPTLNAISNPSNSNAYNVTWTTSSNASTYILQESFNDQYFGSPTEVYNGVSTTWPASGKAAGTYSYRVKAHNATGDSAWSGTQSTTVNAPTGPTPGFWSSATGDEFYVTPDSANVTHFAIYIGVPSGCGGGTIKITHTGSVPISSNSFSYSGSLYYSGTFDSTTAAHGTDGLNSFYYNGCYLNGGPWAYNATWQNTTQPTAPLARILQPLSIQSIAKPAYYHIVDVLK